MSISKTIRLNNSAETVQLGVVVGPHAEYGSIFDFELTIDDMDEKRRSGLNPDTFTFLERQVK